LTCSTSQEGECEDEAYIPRFPIPNPYNVPDPVEESSYTDYLTSNRTHPQSFKS
jgi:hypothetical protein